MTYYESATGPQRGLAVLAPPSATLVSYSAPSRRRSGASVSISVTIRNDGGGAGYCNAQLEDRGTGAVLSGVGDTLAAGASATWTFPAVPTMPNRDWLLRIRYGHQEYGEQYWDGSRDFTVELSVPTSLSLTLSPSSVDPGATVNWVGTLSPGVAGASIVLQLGPDWTQVATAITDAAGSFSGSFTAPTTPGTYTYRPYFGGSSLTYYEEVAGPEVGLQVGLIIPPEWLPWLQGIAVVAPTVTVVAIIACQELKRAGIIS